MPRICVVGSANMDLVFRTPRLPRPGESLVGHSFSQAFGGKGANQAVAAARLGAAVTLIARVGCDAFGDAIRDHLKKEGVNVDHLGTDPAQATGVAGIIVDDAGGNAIVAAAGAGQTLLPDAIERAGDAIRSASALVCQREVPAESVVAALRIARSASVQTLFNPSPALTIPNDLWGLVDICVPNEVEAELLTGQAIGSPADAATAGWELIRRGPKTVIVTVGERGAMVVTAERAEHIPAWPVQTVDTTGAGDAFVGGLAVFLAEGLPMMEAVKKANAVAALSTTRLGAQTALPSRQELEAFIN